MMMRTVVALLLVSSIGVLASAKRHAVIHRGLRTTAPKEVTAIDEEAKVRNVFGAFSQKMGSLYMLKKEKDDVLQMPQGMSVPLQDPDDLVSPLLKKLDKKCATRFEETLHGEAKGMHALDLSSKTLKKDCENKFEGKLCSTKATILTEQKDPGTQNDVKASFVMNGESCIPEECVSSQNLAALADFMRGRAQTMAEENMGEDLKIALNVDCSEVKRGGEVHSPAPKSGAAAGFAPAALTSILLGASLLAFA
jgi:hypothetical protein